MFKHFMSSRIALLWISRVRLWLLDPLVLLWLYGKSWELYLLKHETKFMWFTSIYVYLCPEIVLFDKRRCLLVEQEEMCSCWKRRSVFLLNKKKCVLVEEEVSSCSGSTFVGTIMDGYFIICPPVFAYLVHHLGYLWT